MGGRARLALLLGAAFASGGCEPADPPPPPVPAAAQMPRQPRQDLPDEVRSLDLFGAWLVESVSAPTPVRSDEGWHPVLLAGSRQLEILSQCIRIGPFNYARLQGEGIAVSQAEPPARAPQAKGLPTPVQCARTLTPTERVLPGILLGAQRVVRQPDGAVLVSSPAGTVLLRRPSGPLANPRAEAPPPPRPPLLGAWRFVRVDGRELPPDAGMELLLRPSAIEWRSGCVNEARELTIDRDTLVPGAVDPFPVCERGRSEAEQAIGRLTSGRIAARMSREGQLVLSGSGVTAELAPLT